MKSVPMYATPVVLILAVHPGSKLIAPPSSIVSVVINAQTSKRFASQDLRSTCTSPNKTP